MSEDEHGGETNVVKKLIQKTTPTSVSSKRPRTPAPQKLQEKLPKESKNILLVICPGEKIPFFFIEVGNDTEILQCLNFPDEGDNYKVIESVIDSPDQFRKIPIDGNGALSIITEASTSKFKGLYFWTPNPNDLPILFK